jgi:hypothetical protein
VPTKRPLEKLSVGEAMQMVKAFYREHPDEPWRDAQVAERLGIGPSTVSYQMRKLASKKTVRRVARGKYILDSPSDRNGSQSIPQPPLVNEMMFKPIGETEDGRVILQDGSGGFWVASKL